MTCSVSHNRLPDEHTHTHTHTHIPLLTHLRHHASVPHDTRVIHALLHGGSISTVPSSRTVVRITAPTPAVASSSAHTTPTTSPPTPAPSMQDTHTHKAVSALVFA